MLPELISQGTGGRTIVDGMVWALPRELTIQTRMYSLRPETRPKPRRVPCLSDLVGRIKSKVERKGGSWR